MGWRSGGTFSESNQLFALEAWMRKTYPRKVWWDTVQGHTPLHTGSSKEVILLDVAQALSKGTVACEPEFSLRGRR